MDNGSNRLLIFVFYDKDGIVDDYVLYYLKSLSENISHMVIVCNGILNDEGRKKLEDFTEDVFVRTNIGLDAGAIKDVLVNLYGWDKVLAYDELLIANDTVFGPVYPLKPMFEEMNKRDCDFWGITEHFDISGFVAPHVQSYFINVKQVLLKSDDFKSFWEAYVATNSKYDTVRTYEEKFSIYFSSLGYRFSAFIDVTDFLAFSVNDQYNYPFYDMPNMLSKSKCPLVKKSSFGIKFMQAYDFLGHEKTNKIMNFIEKNTDYDVNLIWNNIIRIYNVTNIKNSLYLNYILETKMLNHYRETNCETDAVVIVYLYYYEFLEKCMIYLGNIPNYMDIVIITPNIEIAEAVKNHFSRLKRKNFEVRVVREQCGHMEAFFLECNDLFFKYEYLCFTHDGENSPKRSSQSLRYILWENTLSSEMFIENVLTKFKSNSRMGFLSVPLPYHANFISSMGDFWEGCFDSTKALAQRIGLKCNLSEQVSAFSKGPAFWCRTSAMKTLFEYNFNLEDFLPDNLKNDNLPGALERIFPYAAQHEGFYSAIVSSDDYAEIRLTDLEIILASIMDTNFFTQENIDSRYGDTLSAENESLGLGAFCKNLKNVYIYGTGEMAEIVWSVSKRLSITVCGFIVSNGQEKVCYFSDKPVFWLSEVDLTKEDSGVILGLSQKNVNSVIPLLKENKVRNYISVFNNRLGIFSLLDKLESAGIYKFCKRFKKVYIYGTGYKAKYVWYALNQAGIDFEGFIVSDGQNKFCEFSNKLVFWLSEVQLFEKGVGIVIGIGEKYFSEIKRNLKDIGFKNYLRLS